MAAAGREGGPVGPGELCSLGNLLEVALERAHQKLAGFITSAGEKSEECRREELLHHLHRYRQQLLRLVTLVGWLRRRPESANALGQARLLLDRTGRHQALLQETADKLFFLWRDELEVFRAPVYDVPTALEVLTTGHYSQLPSCIEELRGVGEVGPAEKAAAVRRMDMLLRCCLLDAALPAGLQVLSTRDGQSNLRAAGRYEVALTLVPAPETPAEESPAGRQDGPDAKPAAAPEDGAAAKTAQAAGPQEQRWRWCVVSVKMLPGSRLKQQLTSRQSAQLRELIQAQMWAAAEKAEKAAEEPAACATPEDRTKPALSDPLQRMHQLLGDIAARLLVDNLVTTARALSAPGANWEALIKVEPLPAPQAGVALAYWPDSCSLLPPAAAGAEKPTLQVQIQDGEVAVSHVPQLLDPSTGQPAAVAVDPLYADSERLLLAAAVANARAQLRLLDAAFQTPDTLAQLKPGGIGLRLLEQPALGPDVPASQQGADSPAGQCADSPDPGADPMSGLSLPSIQMTVAGIPMLSVHFNLKTGKLSLRTGPGLGREGGMDVANVLKQEEARMHAIQANPAEAQRSIAQMRRAEPGMPPSGAAPPVPVVEIIAARLLNFFKRIAYRDILTQLMVASRPLLLQYMPGVPRHLNNACKAAAGGMPSYYLAFPPIPLPPGFPLQRLAGASSPTDPAAVALQAGDTVAGADGAKPASLRFHLGVEAPRVHEAPGQDASRFSLFVSSANLPGMSIEALRRVTVPPSNARTLQEAAASVQLGKRKRLEEVAERGGADSGDAAAALSWGRDSMEELAGVVEWCQQQIVWEQLRAQLDALQVNYTEEVVLGSPSEGSAAGAPTRRINLLGSAESAAWPEGERAVLEVPPHSSVACGRWRVALVSAQLAGLPASLGAGPEVELLPAGAGERHQEQRTAPGADAGFVLSYSLADGHTLVETLMDVERAMHTATVTRSIARQLCPPAATPPPVSSAAALTRAATMPTGALGNGDLPADGALKAEDGSSAEGAKAAAAELWEAHGQLRLRGVGLMAFALEWRPPPLPAGLHTVAFAPPSALRVCFRLTSAEAGDAARPAPKSPEAYALPALVCRVRSEPPLVRSVLDTLGEMVAAGEEGLALDALRCVAAPLTALAGALAPPALAAAGLAPSQVVAHSTGSPYDVLLLVQPQPGAAHFRLQLRMYATGLVWLGLGSGAAAPLPNLPGLLAGSLAAINQAVGALGLPHLAIDLSKDERRPALWIKAPLLGAALRAVFAHLAAHPAKG